jgi:hypothetical protein
LLLATLPAWLHLLAAAGKTHWLLMGGRRTL